MKLKTKLPLFTSVTVLTSILLIAFNSIYNFRDQADKDIERYRTEETNTIKMQLIDIVNIAYDMIDHSYQQSSDAGVRERYGFDLEDTLDEAGVKMVVANMLNITLENLRVLRFGTDGYLWINEYEPPHVVVMHASMPQLEGEPHVFYVGETDVNVYDAYTQAIKDNNGEGILKYDFYKPETKEWVPKISFIKLYEPLGWVIGTGVYEDYIDKTVKQKKEDLNKRINSMIRQTVVIGAILTLIATLVLYYFGNSVSQPIRMIESQLDQMSKGLVVEKLAIERNDEIGQMKKSLDALIDGFAAYAGFARQIGRGNLESEFKLLSDKDNLGNSLLEMRDSLRHAREEESKRQEENKRRQWAAEGLAVLGDIIRLGSGREKEMMVDVLKKLTEYVNAIMGGIFVLNDYNKENIFLEQTASVAYQNSKYIKKRVYPGDGLVGQCYLEKEKIYMTNLPDNYIEVHTGLGQANPKNLLLVPLIMDNNVLGVLELASMEIIEDYKIDFIERLSQSLAIAIASYRISLEEIQRNEDLKAQEAANANINPNFIEDV
ncbi:MAG: cache domain-containing protein [Bacteroidales bacterium]|nr:cache domain-containing protein [Bacteroidales bacterium]